MELTLTQVETVHRLRHEASYAMLVAAHDAIIYDLPYPTRALETHCLRLAREIGEEIARRPNYRDFGLSGPTTRWLDSIPTDERMSA